MRLAQRPRRCPPAPHPSLRLQAAAGSQYLLRLPQMLRAMLFIWVLFQSGEPGRSLVAGHGRGLVWWGVVGCALCKRSSVHGQAASQPVSQPAGQSSCC